MIDPFVYYGAIYGSIFSLFLLLVFWIVIMSERKKAKQEKEEMIKNLMNALRRFEDEKNGEKK